MFLVLKQLVTHLINQKFDFDFRWDDHVATYYLHIILGNTEYLVDTDDYDRIKELYYDIKTYWTN